VFLGDNPDNSIIPGGLWSNVQRPPLTGENAESDLNKKDKNNVRFIRSKSGNRIIFDDTKDNEKLQIISSDNSRLEFAASGTKLLFRTDGEMKISAKGKITINGKECRINASKSFLSQSKDMKLESKGKDINIKAGNAIGIKGNGINLN
jgi:uncharacterized protein involved in type VI secretion and phage assembly